MTSVALGAGGERAVAWEVGVLAGLADDGLDLRQADTIVGTSAGALVAARLAAGFHPHMDATTFAARPSGPAPMPSSLFFELGALWAAAGGSDGERRRALGAFAVEHSPGGERAFVARTATLLPSRWPSALKVVAVDAESGERVVFDAGSGVPLASAVAASRAVPGLRPPIQIDGRCFIDGALGSATNADLLDGFRIVIAPFPAEPRNPVEALWLAALQAEAEAGLVITAGPADLEAMGPDPMSDATAARAVMAGYDRGAQMSPCRAA